MDSGEDTRTTVDGALARVEYDRLVQALVVERFRPVPRRSDHVETAPNAVAPGEQGKA